MRNVTHALNLNRTKLTRLTRRLFINSLFLGAVGANLARQESERIYKTGYSDIMKLGRDLRAALPPKYREKIAVQPISIETDNQPFARLLYLKDGSKEVRGVWISAGFIDLVNHVAHAQAIDRRVDGYFRRYVELLEAGGVPTLPEGDEATYWSEELLNEQRSNFNSIVGVVIGMKLANHYLGHYEQTEGTNQSALGAVEWEKAFLHGVHNALRAGCMTEGAAPFFESIDRMKARPAWVQDFIHPKVKFASVRPAMEAAQRDFLAGSDGSNVGRE